MRWGWQTRAQQEIEGYTSGTGMVRRPDLVIVNDPSRPPTQDNINRIVEMKFNDPDDPAQLAAYQVIAGDPTRASIQRADSCDCDNQNRERIAFAAALAASMNSDRVLPPAGGAIPIPVGPDGPSFPEPEPEDDGPGGWVIFGLGLLTLGAILSPFDGPAGDIVAGAAFLTALGFDVGTGGDNSI